MTLLEKLEAKKDGLGHAGIKAVEACKKSAREFKAQLGGEEMVEKIAQALRDADNGENLMYDIAKAALAKIMEMI